MVKFENDYAKVLYKASFNSYSKTCTTISNQTRVTKKTSILRIKPSRHKLFYADKGKIKRDLSIETDLCKLRRRFKQKLMMLSHADAKSANTARTPISAKSRYSSYTQESPIEEFRSDNSGCGDNYETDPPRYRINKEDLMYDNLNLLFETWVQQMLQDKDLKTLMHAAFEKPMKNSESKKEGKSSSCTTYLLDDINKISNSNSIKQSLNSSGEFFPPSFNTVPVTYKALRLISTLSLPKNMYGQKRKFRKYKTKLKTYRMKKRRHNKMLVKLIQPNMNIDEVSDINIGMIEVVTKSWLRRCANIDEKKIKGKMSPAQPQIVCWADVLPPPNVTHKYTEKITDQEVSTNNDGHKETKRTDTNTTTTFDKNNKNSRSNNTFKHCSRGDTVLKKNVNTEYSYHKANVQTSTLLQGAGQRDPGVTSDILNQNHNYPDVILEGKQRTRTCCKASKKDIGILCKRSKSNHRFANNRTYDEYERKPFTRVDKKVKKNKKAKESVMNNLQTALNFFDKNTDKNFNFDLRMSISPTKLQTYQHAATDVMKTTKYINRSCAAISIITSFTENKTNEKKYQKADGDQSHFTDNTDKPNPESINSRSPPNIIPLLDGAVSKDEYVFKADNLTTDPKHLITKLPTNEEIQIQTSVTKELGLKDEINEIKMALRNITLLFDACIISQHKKHLNTPKSKKKLPDLSDNLSADADATIKLSDKTLPKSPITVPETKISRNKKQSTGIKFSKEGRKSHSSQIDAKTDPKRNRKSNDNNFETNAVESYRIIESESLIEITNMTTTLGKKESSNTKSVALTCSLPRTRSLYEKSDVNLMKKSSTKVKHNLSLKAKSSLAQNDKSRLKRIDKTSDTNHSSRGTKTNSSVNSVKYNTPKDISNDSVNEKHSTTKNTFGNKSTRSKIKERQNIESNETMNSMVNCQSLDMKPTSRCLTCNQKNNETKNVLCYHNNIQTNEGNIYICHRSCVTGEMSDRKGSSCCKTTSSTQTKIVSNNPISCHQATSPRNIESQERCHKTTSCLHKPVLANNTNNSASQKNDSSKTSFCCQTFLATKTAITIGTDDSSQNIQINSDMNTIEKAYSTELKTTRLSQTNANDTTTTNDKDTNSAKDLPQGVNLSAPSDKMGITFNIRKSESFNKTVTVNLGDDSCSKLKSTRNSKVIRWIKICLLLILPILIMFALGIGYILFINNDITLKKTQLTEKTRVKKSYVKLNISELGF